MSNIMFAGLIHWIVNNLGQRNNLNFGKSYSLLSYKTIIETSVVC